MKFKKTDVVEYEFITGAELNPNSKVFVHFNGLLYKTKENHIMVGRSTNTEKISSNSKVNVILNHDSIEDLINRGIIKHNRIIVNGISTRYFNISYALLENIESLMSDALNINSSFIDVDHKTLKNDHIIVTACEIGKTPVSYKVSLLIDEV